LFKYKLIILLSLTISLITSCSPKTEEIKVYDYNTKRVVGEMEEYSNIDPVENKRIIPYILKEDKLDLLAGGIALNLIIDRDQINMIEKNFPHMASILESVRERDFHPTLLVYYSNDTKETDTICVYEDNRMIYYCRFAYYDSSIETKTF